MRRAGTAGRWHSLRLLGLFVAISVAARWLSLVLDVIDIDEASHVVGARVLQQGGLLYTDFVDNKPPLLYVAFALAQLVGGPGLAGVHLVTATIVVPLTALAVSACYGHRRTGVVAAIALIVYGAAFIGHDMLATNAEVLMILPASWAVVQLRDAQRAASNTRILTAGLLFGTASLIKPQVATWVLAAAVAIAHLHASRGEARRAVRPLALLAAAAVAPAGLVLAYFTVRGGAEALIYWMGPQNVWYAGNPISPSEALERWLSYFVSFAIATAPLWWGWRSSWELMRERYWMLFSSALIVASLPPVFAGFRFFPHYFIQLLVPLALAAAPWLDDVVRRPLPRAGRVVIGWTTVMLAGFTVANAVLYLGPPGTVYSERLPVYREVAERLRADACAPGATLFVWGFAPNLYYYAEMHPASRFVALSQARLTGYIPGNLASNRGDIAAEATVVPAHWDWLMSDLDRHRATFIVDTAPANLYRWGRYPVSDFPRLQRYLDDQFDLVETIREVRIYRRRGCEAPGASRVTPGE